MSLLHSSDRYIEDTGFILKKGLLGRLEQMAPPSVDTILEAAKKRASLLKAAKADACFSTGFFSL